MGIWAARRRRTSWPFARLLAMLVGGCEPRIGTYYAESYDARSFASQRQYCGRIAGPGHIGRQALRD